MFVCVVHLGLTSIFVFAIYFLHLTQKQDEVSENESEVQLCGLGILMGIKSMGVIWVIFLFIMILVLRGSGIRSNHQCLPILICCISRGRSLS